MKKLSFKDYLESKDQLREAIANEPFYTTQYNIIRYCRLIIENDKEKTFVNLKPGHILRIDWHQKNDQIVPEPQGVIFENVKHLDSCIKFKISLNKNNLINWLNRNSHEEIFENVGSV